MRHRWTVAGRTGVLLALVLMAGCVDQGPAADARPDYVQARLDLERALALISPAMMPDVPEAQRVAFERLQSALARLPLPTAHSDTEVASNGIEGTPTDRVHVALLSLDHARVALARPESDSALRRRRNDALADIARAQEGLGRVLETLVDTQAPKEEAL